MISARVRLFIPALLLAGCSATAPLPAAIVPTPAPPLVQVAPVNVRIGIALGGGAAKGFAHIGVIKMLEANGLIPEVVAGTSAGSLVGALYASGMDVFRLQQNAVALDETGIRDMSLFSGGLIKGQRLQDYVNEMVGQRPFQRLPKRFAVVATRLDTGARTVFARGNVGQAVRASCSIPGLFEPARIGNATYVDGGLVSPVPVDAARELGADIVIAVDISSKASGQAPDSLLGVVNQSIKIMGQKLGQQELARADIIIRPNVNNIGPVEFEQRGNAIIEGEKAALRALPQIRAKIASVRAQLVKADADRIARAAAERRARENAAREASTPPPCRSPGLIGGLFGSTVECPPTAQR